MLYRILLLLLEADAITTKHLPNSSFRYWDYWDRCLHILTAGQPLIRRYLTEATTSDSIGYKIEFWLPQFICAFFRFSKAFLR